MVRCPLRILQMHLFLLVQMHQMLLRGVTPPSYSLGPSRTGLGESGIHRAAEKRSSRKPSPTGPTLYGEVLKGKSISHTPVEGKQIPQPHEYPHHCGRSHDGPGSSVHYVGNQKDYAAHPYRKQNRTRY